MDGYHLPFDFIHIWHSHQAYPQSKNAKSAFKPTHKKGIAGCTNFARTLEGDVYAEKNKIPESIRIWECN
jgi:hypothetical protein